MIFGFQSGDHVGIKDSPEFNHWSRRGVVVGMAEGPDGDPAFAAARVNVVPEGAHDAVPMLQNVLVKLSSSGTQENSDEWYAQAFPTNGDAPGPKMYFSSARDVQTFAAQFSGLGLDETLKVHAPGWASDAEREMVRVAGGVVT
jgi:hypothetical protein